MDEAEFHVTVEFWLKADDEDDARNKTAVALTNISDLEQYDILGVERA